MGGQSQNEGDNLLSCAHSGLSERNLGDHLLAVIGSWESVHHGDSALLNRLDLSGSLYENASQTRLLEVNIMDWTVQEILHALSSMTSMMEQVSKERVCRRPANPISSGNKSHSE